MCFTLILIWEVITRIEDEQLASNIEEIYIDSMYHGDTLFADVMDHALKCLEAKDPPWNETDKIADDRLD